MDVEALQAYFSRQSLLPQKLGTYDCVTFVIGGLYVGWGRDYRGYLDYFDRKTAVQRLRTAGGLRSAFMDVFGPMESACELPPGSIVLWDKPLATVGLVMNGYAAVKGNKMIYRGIITDQMLGWRTD